MPSANAARGVAMADKDHAKRRIKKPYFRVDHGSGLRARQAVLGDHFSRRIFERQAIVIVMINFFFSLGKITDHFSFLSICACFELV